MNPDAYPFQGGRGEPPDLRAFFGKYRKIAIAAAIAIVVIIAIAASYYQVNPDEIGVVTTFGKFSRISQPGPHLKVPIAQEVQTIKGKRLLKAEFGFRTEEAGVKSSFRRDDRTLMESLMLTGDLNVAVVEWIVHYQISDPYKYVFKVRNVEDTLRDLSEATMRLVVGDYSVTEVLTLGREEVREIARTKLAELCELYDTGIVIKQIEIRDSAPPDPVKPSFNEVNQAEQERDRMQNEAWSMYNKEIPKARGEAKRMVQEAEGYAVERVNRARGEVRRFTALQKEYAAAPRVTRSRIYLETLSEILPEAGRKIIVDARAEGVVPMLFPLTRAQGLGGTGGAP